ncbi:MAG: thioredoxin domain-containing protein [Chloroflexota bacterium]
MTNHLAGETSPYLLQHAHNPVDWYPWGPEALARAKAEDRPILLSVGYSACHWCHVMERESFEDLQTAALMNDAFVNIKVDREERPDIDGIYMQAVQAMTGSGGWPMTVFLTPDGTPFFGGTYYPPTDRHGQPSFSRVLTAIAGAWRDRREEVLESGSQLREHLQTAVQPRLTPGALTPDILMTAARGLIAMNEPRDGGFGTAPKFPQPMAIECLLRAWKRTGNQEALNVATFALGKMAKGGIHDHLGGGFARYSTDNEWLVPHFEKMLYDNAQLARAYLMAYQANGDASFGQVVEDILDYVLRDMTDPDGGFYSTEDADSEGEEGKFYVWRPQELIDLLGPEDGRLFSAFYDVREPGNFEGQASILHMTQTPAQVAAANGVTDAELLTAIERGRQVLFAARAHRVRPARDEKVLASWNGMMLRAFAEAGRVLERVEYIEAARRNASFLLNQMRDAGGAMHRTWKRGHGARLHGYLEDQANVADGFVALYEATFDVAWLDAAVALAEIVLDRFADPEGGFFDTSSDHEELISRPKDIFDNATPSGNSVTADVLLRLSVHTGREEFRTAAQRILESLREPMLRYPLGFARALNALDFYLGRPKEVAIVGESDAEDTRALVREVFTSFLPNKVVAGGAARGPLLEGRQARNGQATAYVCQRYVCQAPVTDPASLRALLNAA